MRKSIHVLVGAGILICAVYVKEYYSIILLYRVLFGILLASLFADFLIADLRVPLPIYHHVQRKHEESSVHSSTYFIASSLLSLMFFEFNIALTAIAILTFGDAVAAIIGKAYGTPFFRKKSVIGSSALFLMSVLSGAVFLHSAPIILGMAVAGTLVEIFVDNIDDNLMIPLFSGLVGQLLFSLL